MATQRKSELLLALARAEAELARLRAEDTAQIRDQTGAAAAIRLACAANPEQEAFVAVLLDSRQRTLAVRVIALGSLAQVEVHPRELFRDAVRMAAHAMIIGHNHPSGDPRPSDADHALTRRMVDAGKLLGIPVLDHLVVTPTDLVSFAAMGML